MERIDTRENHGYPVSFLRDRRFIGATLAVGLLAFGTDAYARPEPIPKPVEKPGDGKSPGTGEKAPDDPEAPPPIPPPKGIECTKGSNKENCDPGRPDDKQLSNKPGKAWYDDMAYRMYYLQDSLDYLSTWAGSEDYYIYYYATWMKSVVQQYYALGYETPSKPKEYPYGKMTRGDYNYVYYYWVRPIYYSLLYYSADYYEKNKHEPQIPEYKERLRYVADNYHPLVLCNYGFNGEDLNALEDTQSVAAEASAGIR